ncbi:MAG: glycosyltransferase family 2 protein [Verrucomicrobia bacterium]|nr:glycosyltransferase family 2 protein [Verrucomicrobiota bacterium]
MFKISVIIPAYNERENIPIVVERLEALLVDRKWEAVFVDDDSRDGSLEVLMDLARTKSNVRFIRRIGRRGLASACLEGMASSAADVFAVMDCDLQHDETILPKMLAAFEEDPDLELAVGTRYAGEGGGVGNWSKARVFISRFATNLGSLARKTELSDPMSGFFAIRRDVFEQTVRQMTGKGFKILLDMVLSAGRPLKTREFSYEFRTRQHGESKLDIVVGFEYLYLLADKIFGRFVPVSFVVYVLAGLSGLFLHLATLGILFRYVGIAFVTAQLTATLVAMVSNFLVNNSVTFRQQRLKGAMLLPGLLAYIAICGLGAIVNVQASEYLFENRIPWWFAGAAGALVGAVWNYAVSTQIVWTWLPGILRKSPKPK